MAIAESYPLAGYELLMSEQHVQRVQQIFELGADPSKPVADPAWFAEDVEVDPGELFGALGQEYRGYAGVIEFWTSWAELWTGIEFDLHEVIDAPAAVVVELTQRARGRDGVVVDQAYAMTFAFDDDNRVRRFKFFRDLAEARAAAT